MRKEYEASGYTVDEAIDKACVLAGVDVDMAEIKVIDLGGKGFLGFGHRDARVMVIVDLPDKPLFSSANEIESLAKAGKKQDTENRSRGEKPAKPAKAEKPVKSVKAEKTPKSEKTDKPEKTVSENKAPVEKEQDTKEEANQASAIEAKVTKPVEKQHNRNDRRPRKRNDRTDNRHEEKDRHEERHQLFTEIDAETEAEVVAQAMKFLRPVFAKMGVTPQGNSQVIDGIVVISFSGTGLGILIGRRGETLNALQYLTNLVVNKNRPTHIRISLDVEGYRKSREETLTALAHKMADKAVKSGRRIELEPMNPHERRVVHIALQQDKRVETSSHGEEPYRRVVISKKRGDRRRSPKNRPAAEPQTGGNNQAADHIEEKINQDSNE